MLKVSLPIWQVTKFAQSAHMGVFQDADHNGINGFDILSEKLASCQIFSNFTEMGFSKCWSSWQHLFAFGKNWQVTKFEQTAQKGVFQSSDHHGTISFASPWWKIGWLPNLLWVHTQGFCRVLITMAPLVLHLVKIGRLPNLSKLHGKGFFRVLIIMAPLVAKIPRIPKIDYDVWADFGDMPIFLHPGQTNGVMIISTLKNSILCSLSKFGNLPNFHLDVQVFLDMHITTHVLVYLSTPSVILMHTCIHYFKLGT